MSGTLQVVDIKRVIEHVVFFEHIGPHGEELPLDAPVPIRDDPLYSADDQMVVMLDALRELDNPGETLELRARRQFDISPALFVHVTLGGAGQYAVRVTHATGFPPDVANRLTKEGLRAVEGDNTNSGWLLDEYPATLVTMPRYLDELIGYVLRYRDDYEVEEVPEGTEESAPPGTPQASGEPT